jgi:hypothetical protein
MLFHSSIQKDLARSFGAKVVVLATIVKAWLLFLHFNLSWKSMFCFSLQLKTEGIL